MLETILSYEDWNDFFTKRLVESGAYRLSETINTGNTCKEIYSPLKGDPDTIIQVGYFSPMTLIYINIINPATPGKNRQQEIEHLYKYQFDDEKQYGPPGLDFEEINILGISSYLDQGFHGSETVYYRNGKAVKSKLTTSCYADSPQSSHTFHFHQESFFKRIKNRMVGQNIKYDEIKTVQLQAVFSGLKSN
ncbi:MAG TPA: hypothetical protein VHK91_11590 [Flavisolibacter sp.]|jgi:hypothetical protein|nr:hypothetical protein [Flavisolibacter sp.]